MGSGNEDEGGIGSDNEENIMGSDDDKHHPQPTQGREVFLPQIFTNLY